MNLDEIEELIRRYLSAGITVVIILVAPSTGGTDDGRAPDGEPSVVTIDPDRAAPVDGAPDPRVRELPSGGDPDPDPTGQGPTDGGPDGDDTDPGEDPGEDPERDPAGDPAAGGPGQDPPPDDRSSADDTAPGGPGRSPDDVDPDAYLDDEDRADEDTADEDTASKDRADEDTADDTADPDLDSRGPADGSEPGIDDELAAAPGDRPTRRDPSGDEDTAATDIPVYDIPGGDIPGSDIPGGDIPGSDIPGSDIPGEGLPADVTGGDPEAAPREVTGSGPSAAGEGTTAAERYGWGAPDREDDFGSGLAQWDLYEGPGHAGNGQRSAAAVTVRDGVLTITGDAEGTTGGMSWGSGQRYGRWEGRVRAPASDPSYNALLLLWPDADDFPAGGEIDFMEMLDPTRQRTDFFLHHGPDNDQVTAQVEVDGTQWHNWAVEWTPEEIVGYVDGEEWFRTTDTGTFPPGPMHLCIQLDWFPDGGGSVQESTMEIDWVRQYAPEPADPRPSDEVASTGPASAAEPADDPLRGMFSWR